MFCRRNKYRHTVRSTNPSKRIVPVDLVRPNKSFSLTSFRTASSITSLAGSPIHVFPIRPGWNTNTHAWNMHVHQHHYIHPSPQSLRLHYRSIHRSAFSWQMLQMLEAVANSNIHEPYRIKTDKWLLSKHFLSMHVWEGYVLPTVSAGSCPESSETL